MAALIALCVIFVVGAAPIIITFFNWAMGNPEPYRTCNCDTPLVCCVNKEEDCE